MMARYSKWLEKSNAVFMMEYKKMDMKVIDGIRAKVREAGGESHVVKNTLMQKVLSENDFGKMDLASTNLVGFAFNDVSAVAKAIVDISKDYAFRIKGGYLNKDVISGEEIKALASLPPLPVMRAKLLGTILLLHLNSHVLSQNRDVRLAAVVQAHVTKEEAPAAE
jgi:large subunit ribosomal protein L10